MDQAGRQFSKSQRSGAEDTFGVDTRCPRHGAPGRAHSQRARDPGPDTLSPQRRAGEERRAASCVSWLGSWQVQGQAGRGEQRSSFCSRCRPEDRGQRPGDGPRGGVAEGGQECPGPSSWPGWSPAVGRAPAYPSLVRCQHCRGGA